MCAGVGVCVYYHVYSKLYAVLHSGVWFGGVSVVPPPRLLLLFFTFSSEIASDGLS